jgi:hypothetical protein
MQGRLEKRFAVEVDVNTSQVETPSGANAAFAETALPLLREKCRKRLKQTKHDDLVL